MVPSWECHGSPAESHRILMGCRPMGSQSHGTLLPLVQTLRLCCCVPPTFGTSGRNRNRNPNTNSSPTPLHKPESLGLLWIGRGRTCITGARYQSVSQALGLRVRVQGVKHQYRQQPIAGLNNVCETCMSRRTFFSRIQEIQAGMFQPQRRGLVASVSCYIERA